MALTLTVKGTSYTFPQVDDEDWGDQVTLWAQAVTGVIVPFLDTPTSPIAQTGVIALGNGDKISWRDNTNTNDAGLTLDNLNHLVMTLPDGSDIDLSTLGTGDVHGPSSSTDNALPRFDLTTGKFIQGSNVVVDDADNISGINVLTAAHYGTINADTVNADLVGDVTGNVAGIVTGSLVGPSSGVHTGNVVATLANVTTANIATLGVTGTLTGAAINGTILGASTNIGSSTPAVDKLYGDTIVKAWAVVASNGTITSSVNFSGCNHSGTGDYTLTFRRAMGSSDGYALMVCCNDAGVNSGFAVAYARGTTTCRVLTYGSRNSLDDIGFTVLVVGAN